MCGAVKAELLSLLTLALQRCESSPTVIYAQFVAQLCTKISGLGGEETFKLCSENFIF